MRREEMMTTDEQLMKEAKRRAKLKIGFMWHAAAYVLVNTFLVILNFMTGAWEFWALWPMLGWGLGLAFHAVGVMFEFSRFSTNSMVAAEYERLKRETGGEINYDYYTTEESREN